MEIHCGTSGLPPTESLITRNPEISGAIERQSGSSLKRNAVAPVKTAQITISNTAERTAPVLDWRPYNPNVPIMVLYDSPNTIRYALVRRECSVLPVGHPFRRSDPQAAVACGQKIEDLIAGKPFGPRRTPGDETHSVKTYQSRVSPDPEI